MKQAVGDLISMMDTIAPERWAEDWDNVGLQVGEAGTPVDKVLLALEITDAVLSEAIEKEVNLIITHHPMYLAPPAHITGLDGTGRLMLGMIHAGIAHYAAHTNLDKSACSPDMALCGLLKLQEVKPLVVEKEGYCQLVTFCPPEHTKAVRDALFEAGCGTIGAYSRCSFSGKGTGTFQPGEGTHPHIGSIDALSEVEEMRVEVIVPKSSIGSAVAAVKTAHPYEEPVIDLYPIEAPQPGIGMGRFGVLPTPLPLCQLAEKIKNLLGAPAVRVSGEDVTVKTLAVCAGAGGDFAGDALASGADAFLTGEIKHHDLTDIGRDHFPVIAAGHYDTEAPAMALLAARLREDMRAAGYDAEVIVSSEMRAPARLI